MHEDATTLGRPVPTGHGGARGQAGLVRLGGAVGEAWSCEAWGWLQGPCPGSRPHRERADLGVLVTGNWKELPRSPVISRHATAFTCLLIMACSTHCLWDQRPQNTSPTLELRISRGLQETAGTTDHDRGAGLGESHLSTPALRPTCPVHGQSQGRVPPTGAGFPPPQEESSEVCGMSLSPVGHPHM